VWEFGLRLSFSGQLWFGSFNRVWEDRCKGESERPAAARKSTTSHEQSNGTALRKHFRRVLVLASAFCGDRPVCEPRPLRRLSGSRSLGPLGCWRPGPEHLPARKAGGCSLDFSMSSHLQKPSLSVQTCSRPRTAKLSDMRGERCSDVTSFRTRYRPGLLLLS
jgi:hypothetical protein